MKFSRLLLLALINLSACGYGVVTEVAAEESVSVATKLRESKKIEELSSQISADPKNALGYAQRGQCYVRLKDWNKAFADMDTAIRLDPNIALLYTARGDIYGAMGKPAEELADKERAVRMAPTDVQCLKALAVDYASMKKHDKAVSLLTTALSSKPNSHLYLLRSENFIQLKDLPKAKSDLDAALRLEPENKDAMIVKSELESAEARLSRSR